MTYAETIKAARKALRLSQQEVAEKAGVSLSSYQKYEQDKVTPGLDAVRSIATVLRLGDQGGDGVPTVDVPVVSDAAASDTDVVNVPIFGDMAAGPGSVPEVGVVNTVPVPRSVYLVSFRRPTADAEARRVGFFVIRGDSAAPLYFDGEHVPCELLGNTNQHFEQDALYVFRWQDMVMFKRLRRMPGGRIRARSLNPAVEPFEFAPEGDDFAVVARPIQSEKQQLYGSLVGRFLGYAEASNP